MNEGGNEYDIGTFIVQPYKLFAFPLLCSLIHGQMPCAMKAIGSLNWTVSKA